MLSLLVYWFSKYAKNIFLNFDYCCIKTNDSSTTNSPNLKITEARCGYDFEINIIKAVTQGDLDGVKNLMKSFKINSFSEIGDLNGDVLKIALKNNYLHIVKYFVDIGASANGSWMFIACENGCLEVVKYLVGLGETDWMSVPLFMAESRGHYEVVEYLISVGAVPLKLKYPSAFV